MQRSNAQWELVGAAWLLGGAFGCAATPAPAGVPELPSTHAASTSVSIETSPTDVGSMPQVDAAPAPSRADADSASARESSGQRALPWLSPNHVAAAVRAQEPAFGACQSLGIGSEARVPEGAITVGWLVGADGSVDEVSLGHTTFKSDLVNECLLSVAKKVTFPASQSSAQVSWTVHLRGSVSGPFAEAARYRKRR